MDSHQSKTTPLGASNGQRVLKEHHQNLTNPMVRRCYICDSVELRNVSYLRFHDLVTNYSKLNFPNKIGQLLGSDFMIVVSEDDVICQRCIILVNNIDKFESEAEKHKQMLLTSLNKKYDLQENISSSPKENEALKKDSVTKKTVEKPKIQPKKKCVFKCGTCGASFSEREELLKHFDVHRKRKVYQPKVDENKLLEDSIEKILQEAKSDISDSSNTSFYFTCNICSSNYEQESDYNAHMDTHKQKKQKAATEKVEITENQVIESQVEQMEIDGGALDFIINENGELVQFDKNQDQVATKSDNSEEIQQFLENVGNEDTNHKIEITENIQIQESTESEAPLEPEKEAGEEEASKNSYADAFSSFLSMPQN